MRPAASVDCAFIERVYFETQRWIIEALFGWRGDDFERANFLETYDAPNTQIIVAAGRDVGWLTVQRTDDIHLESIYIVPEEQRKGLGTQLIQNLIAEADATSRTLRLSTARINPARRLYERLGFIDVDESKYKVSMEYHCRAS